jgi:hypothetical protein
MNGKMGERRKNIAYASFDDVNDHNYRCNFERCHKIIRSKKGATNLIAHLIYPLQLMIMSVAFNDLFIALNDLSVAHLMIYPLYI